MISIQNFKCIYKYIMYMIYSNKYPPPPRLELTLNNIPFYFCSHSKYLSKFLGAKGRQLHACIARSILTRESDRVQVSTYGYSRVPFIRVRVKRRRAGVGVITCSPGPNLCPLIPSGARRGAARCAALRLVVGISLGISPTCQT